MPTGIKYDTVGPTFRAFNHTDRPPTKKDQPKRGEGEKNLTKGRPAEQPWLGLAISIFRKE